MMEVLQNGLVSCPKSPEEHARIIVKLFGRSYSGQVARSEGHRSV